MVRRRTTAVRRAGAAQGSKESARSSRTAARSSRISARSGRTRLSAKLTTNHAQIRNWVEERGGHPATVKRTSTGKDPAGILRIDFPGFSGARSLKPVSWDEWFRVFDERRLGFLHQNRTASGKPSRFNKLVCRK